jgi:hypothetical protein
MAARSFQIALTAGATRLSDVYIGLTAGGPGGPADNIGGSAGNPDARSDVPYREIFLFSSGAVAFVGGSDMAGTSTTPVSSTTWGMKIQQDAATAPPIDLGPYDTGPMKLSNFWASGAGATLHILAIPY